MDFANTCVANYVALENLLISAKVPGKIRSSIVSLIDGTDFLFAPASTRFHGAKPGGLFQHSLEVAKQLLKWTKMGLIQWERECSPVVVGLLHDWTKVGKYQFEPDLSDPDGGVFCTFAPGDKYYTYGGHGQDSCIKVLNHMQLTNEEVSCIRWHMGAYEGRETWDLFDFAIKKYPAVLWTHHADMVASKIVGV